MKKLVFLAALAASFLAHAESVRLPEYAQVEARAAELSAALAEVKTAIDNQPAPDLTTLDPKFEALPGKVKEAIDGDESLAVEGGLGAAIAAILAALAALKISVTKLSNRPRLKVNEDGIFITNEQE